MNKSKLMKLSERSGLKRAICMGLVCILAVGRVLVGNAEVYRADTDPYKYATWETLVTNPAGIHNTDSVGLYAKEEKTYEWGVTSCTTASGYGMVILSSTNTTITMKSGNAQLTQVGTKQFTISDPQLTSSQPYARFWVTMDYDSYITCYMGYIELME